MVSLPITLGIIPWSSLHWIELQGINLFVAQHKCVIIMHTYYRARVI